MILLKKVNSDWLQVKMTGSGRRGLVPVTYVEKYTPPPRVFRVKAAFAGSGKKLSLTVGEELTLVREVTESWYEVTNRYASGPPNGDGAGPL
jgi:hypothetical protein